MCQTAAQSRNSLKINHLHRLPKQVTLYNICNYLKINRLYIISSKIAKKTIKSPPSPAGLHPGSANGPQGLQELPPGLNDPGPACSASGAPARPAQITRHGEPGLKRFNFVCRSWRGQSSAGVLAAEIKRFNMVRACSWYRCGAPARMPAPPESDTALNRARPPDTLYNI